MTDIKQLFKKYRAFFIGLLALFIVFFLVIFVASRLLSPNGYTGSNLIGNEQVSTLSVDEAAQLAVEQVKGEVKEVNHVVRNGTSLYEIKIGKVNRTYVVYIDKNTKSVLEQIFVEEAKSTSDNQNTNDVDSSTEQNPSTNNSTDTNNASSQDDVPIDSNSEQMYPENITLEKAKQIALNEINGTIIEIDGDYDDGELYYEFKISTGRRVYEIEVHAGSGMITKMELDD